MNLLPDKELGARLRELRKKRGWSQGQFGREMQREGDPVNQSEVSRWESGETYPQYNTVVMWSRALGVPVEVFMVGGQGNESPASLREIPGMPERIIEAWLSDARAAEQRANALLEFAVAARLEAENTRDRQRAISQSERERWIAGVSQDGIERERRRRGSQSGLPPQPTTPDPPTPGPGQDADATDSS